MEQEQDRQLAAKIARQFYEEKISYDDFIRDFPEDTDDSQIEQLFSLIEHWPKVGGLLGISTDKYQELKDNVMELISSLEK